MKLINAIATAAFVSASLVTTTPAYADIRDGTCTLELNFKSAKPKPCKIDFFNSGAIHLIWARGKPSVFKLHDSRLNVYAKTGKTRINFYIHQSSVHGKGHFTNVEDPSVRFSYERFN